MTFLELAHRWSTATQAEEQPRRKKWSYRTTILFVLVSSGILWWAIIAAVMRYL